MTFLITDRHYHKSVVFERLMEQGAVKRVGAGRARVRRVARDKAYTGRRIRTYLRKRGIGANTSRITSFARSRGD